MIGRREPFQVGDRVRCTNGDAWGPDIAPTGALGTVVPCPVHPVVLSVVYDHDPNGAGDGCGWAMFHGQVEHVHGPVRRAARRLRRRWAARRATSTQPAVAAA